MKSIWIAFIVFILAASPLQAKDFIIFGTNDPPYKYHEGDKNEVKGIVVDVLKEVFDELSIKPIFKIVDSDSRIQAELIAGRIQMAMLYSKNAERQRYLIYPDQSFIDISWNLFIRNEDLGKIQFTNYQDLTSLNIGVVKDVSYTEEFLNSGLKFIQVPRTGLELRMLLAKRFDAIPLPTVSTIFEAKESEALSQITYLPKVIKNKPYYNVFSKSTKYPDIQSISQRYDEIILNMKNDGRILRIFEKYLGAGHQWNDQ
ncbi:ABC transporter substrate-binding protein [Litoribacillus peritrichatus]|uniref:substrate-binding periplasmic protein n=1 Tax=Litoribacillus peritrichatus TaxID=718191 RepID=UPI0031CE97E6